MADDGSSRSFRELVRETSGRLLATARLMLGDEHEAEDVVQTAFLKAWERWEGESIRNYAVPWLYRVVRNLSIDRLRQRGPAVEWSEPTAEEPGAEEPTPLSFDRVREAIPSLEEPYRSALLLRYSQKMPYEEIAKTLEVPLGTVKSWICRGVRLLREQFTPAGKESS